MNQTILAVSAPPGSFAVQLLYIGTDVYVSNNDKGKENEIFFSSPGGEIKTYLLPSSADNEQILSTPMNITSPTPATPTISQQADVRKVFVCILSNRVIDTSGI